MGKVFMYTGVTLGCILRCIYNSGGQDGRELHINLASGIARTEPGSLDPEVLELLANQTFGYFYSNQSADFNEARMRLWYRLIACVRGLPETPPEWFSYHSRLADILPEGPPSQFWGSARPQFFEALK
jgi:hypothetical protein